MRTYKSVTWITAALLAVALAGCSNNDHPLGVREGGAPGPSPVALGTAATYVVLAGSAVTNTGPTALTGDLGISPGSALTGFPPGTMSGTTNTANLAAAQAKLDLTAAFNDAAGRTTGAISVSGDMTGLTLSPGLYKSTSSLAISGAVTLDALGDPNAMFIIQMASTLTTGPGSRVVLAGGAQASHIIWQVGTSATLGTNSVFKGTILADQSITANTGATVNGRLLARISAVTMDSDVIAP